MLLLAFTLFAGIQDPVIRGPGFVDSIARGTLLQKLERADMVAVVRAHSLLEDDPRYPEEYSRVAELLVIEDLFGVRESGSMLTVVRMDHGGCMGPFPFGRGERYLALLEKVEETGTWECSAVEVAPDKHGEALLAAYREAVLAWARVRAIPERTEQQRSIKDAQLRDWLVDLAAIYALRWDAVHELRRDTDKPLDEATSRCSARRLTPEQFARLRATLLASGRYGDPELQLYRLICLSELAEPTEWLLGYIENWGDKRPAGYVLWIQEAVRQVGDTRLHAVFRDHYRPLVEVLCEAAENEAEVAGIRKSFEGFDHLVWDLSSAATGPDDGLAYTEEEFLAAFAARLRARHRETREEVGRR